MPLPRENAALIDTWTSPARDPFSDEQILEAVTLQGESNVLDETPEQFAHTPCLGDTAPRVMRCVSVDDSGNLTEAIVFAVAPEFSQPLRRLPARLGRSPIDLQPGRDERPQQPGPDCPLVISAVAVPRTPLITAPGTAGRTGRGCGGHKV